MMSYAAYESHIIGLQDILYIRLLFDHGRVETTAGRLIFNNALFPRIVAIRET